MRRHLGTVAGVCVCLVGFSGSLLAHRLRESAPPAHQAEETADPSKGSKDIDRAVAHPMPQVLDAAKQALLTYGCDIKKERPDYLECTRDRHVGVVVGSGGEMFNVRAKVVRFVADH